MWLALVVLVVTLAIVVKFRGRKTVDNSKFWKGHGIPFIDISGLTNSLELLLGLKDTLQIDRLVYQEMGSSKLCVILEANTPVVIVKDLDVAKLVMVKDFNHFVDRRVLFRESKSPALLKMLPALLGDEWRRVRVSMSPTFTTGRIRRLMECFNNCGLDWVTSIRARIDNSSGSDPTVDIKDSAGRFATDVIAATVFGLQAGSMQDENSLFHDKVTTIGDSSYFTILKQSLALHFPKVFKLLNTDAMDTSAVQFFDTILSESLKARENGEMTARNDFFQLIVEARKGELKLEVNEDTTNFEEEARLSDEAVLQKNSNQCLLDDDVAKGQAVVFIFAGYHGVAMTLTYAAHTLAHHPKIQNRLREELKGKFGVGGTIQYDVVNHLEYMEMFLSEIFRFYPITPRLGRICGKQYENSELGISIPKGTFVEIPVAQIHKDSLYYQRPDEFDPEHFNSENVAKRHPYAFMPFGHGPRNCIGMRFAQVEVKTAIAHMVHNFVIKPVLSCPFPIKTVLVGHGIQIPGNVEIMLTPVKNKN